MIKRKMINKMFIIAVLCMTVCETIYSEKVLAPKLLYKR